MVFWHWCLVWGGIGLCSGVYADEQITTLFVLPPQSQFDASQPYFYELLDAVMKRTEADYGPYEINLVKSEMTQARAVRELSQSRFLSVLIQYPFPMYFFVPPDRPDLQARIAEGLEQLLDEDWLSEYMRQHPLSAALADPALWRDSRIIQLDNPMLPLSADTTNPRYWISPEAFLNSEW